MTPPDRIHVIGWAAGATGLMILAEAPDGPRYEVRWTLPPWVVGVIDAALRGRDG